MVHICRKRHVLFYLRMVSVQLITFPRLNVPLALSVLALAVLLLAGFNVCLRVRPVLWVLFAMVNLSLLLAVLEIIPVLVLQDSIFHIVDAYVGLMAR